MIFLQVLLTFLQLQKQKDTMNMAKSLKVRYIAWIVQVALVPDEVHVSQQSQNTGEDVSHVSCQKRWKHVDKLAAHVTPDYPIQQMILCYLCDDAPVIPKPKNKLLNSC